MQADVAVAQERGNGSGGGTGPRTVREFLERKFKYLMIAPAILIPLLLLVGIDAHGAMADRLVLDGAEPTNCAFSLDRRWLMVTEVGKRQVERLRAPFTSLPRCYSRTR